MRANYQKVGIFTKYVIFAITSSNISSSNLSKALHFWMLKEQVKAVMHFPLASLSVWMALCKHCRSSSNFDNINISPMTYLFSVMLIKVNFNL